jgi:hypothetical protein
MDQHQRLDEDKSIEVHNSPLSYESLETHLVGG